MKNVGVFKRIRTPSKVFLELSYNQKILDIVMWDKITRIDISEIVGSVKYDAHTPRMTDINHIFADLIPTEFGAAAITNTGELVLYYDDQRVYHVICPGYTHRRFDAPNKYTFIPIQLGFHNGKILCITMENNGFYYLTDVSESGTWEKIELPSKLMLSRMTTFITEKTKVMTVLHICDIFESPDHSRYIAKLTDDFKLKKINTPSPDM